MDHTSQKLIIPDMRRITEYLLIFFNILLLVLVIFESRLQLPPWLVPVGRLHPVLLHLPIGLWAGVVILYLLRRRVSGYSTLLLTFIQVTAVFTAVTALAGMILALGADYDASQIAGHKYTGVVLSGLFWLTVIFFDRISGRAMPAVLGLVSLLIIITGHRGGELTHGEDFLSFKPAGSSVQEDDVYAALVAPILKEKCNSCHRGGKTKGGLNLESVALMLKGGENGPALVAGNALESHLMKRIFLPLESKEHMPPRSKTQLTEPEIEILTAWINEGAPGKMSFAQLKPDSPLRKYRQQEPDESYAFPAAGPAALAEVNTPFCRVTPVAVNSPGLRASFFVKARFDPRQLEKLLSVKEQLVDLNLSKMPVSDDDLKVLAEFKNLRHLNLSSTEVTGSFLGYLKDLRNLESVSLANTRLHEPDLQALARLNTVYLWESGFTTEDLSRLKKLNPAIQLDTGQRENERIAINPPESSQKKVFLKQGAQLTLRHALPGVLIRYTLDGTVPDSTHGQVYSRPLTVDKRTRIKARAFKEGWLGSTVLELDYLVNGPEPDSARLSFPPASQYAAKGAKSLYDGLKGDPDNFLDKTWLGYREKPLEAVFFFSTPRELKNMTVSMLEKIDSYIMPPQSIEVWGKSASGKEQFLGKISPVQPTAGRPRRNVYFDMPLPPQKYSEIRVRVNNVNPLPAWHQGKGTPAWVFVDEVVFN